MINKLSKKFVLINMLLVSLVLIISFSFICLFSYQSVKEESYKAMERMFKDKIAPPPLEIGKRGPQKSEPLLPIFSVSLYENMEIKSIRKENVAISYDLIDDITKTALETKKERGILFDFHLRFLIKETPDGFEIVFANIGREIESITRLAISLLIVGSCSLAALFFISLYLSKWALEPAKRAWEQQHQFVADASHELKTPITVILANIDILLSHTEDTIHNQIKWVRNTEIEANRMKKLIENLLFLAKADSPNIDEVIKSQINFSDIVWNTLLPLESLAYEQGIEINSEIESDIIFVGNKEQLKQLVIIFLDNAFKYVGDEGVVTLVVKKVQENVELRVNNTGATIQESHLEHIFERFYRSDSSRTRNQGGYGLGLSIASSIVNNHGGNISAESSSEEGTTFTAVFPIQ